MQQNEQSREPLRAKQTGPSSSHSTLSKVCKRAAEHMANATFALNDESLGANHALAHLDEAIACLRGLSRQALAAGNADDIETPVSGPLRLRSA